MLTDPVNEVTSKIAIMKNKPAYQHIDELTVYPLVEDSISQEKKVGLSYDGVHLKSFSPKGKRMVY